MSRGTTAAKSVAATLAAAAIATPYIEKWEGWENKAYRDIVGVVTACAGETRGIEAGKVYSDDYCKTRLAMSVVEHAIKIEPCLPATMPSSVRASFIVTAYNIGTGKPGAKGGFCGSSMSSLAKAGDFKGACAALDKWNKAGGRPVRGLILRRSDERELCERDLA
jgi:lysozyme